MSGARLYPAVKKTVPASVLIVCLLILLGGILALIGSFVSPHGIKSIFAAFEACVLISTAIFVICNYRWASYMVFLCALMVTIDAGIYYSFPSLRAKALTIENTMILLLRPVVYWAAYLWYRNWRTSPSSGVSIGR